jgi:hypothetical protein
MKERLVSTSICIFLDWTNIFYVHVDASSITLGVVLVQSREDIIDHQVYFLGRNLSESKKKYMIVVVNLPSWTGETPLGSRLILIQNRRK